MAVERNVIEMHAGRLGLYCVLVREVSTDGSFSASEPHLRHVIGGEWVRKTMREVRKDLRDNNATLREV